jgi:5-methylthioadenosine/S-adenosylhomocysteine deaminase
VTSTWSADWVLPVDAPPIPDGAVVVEDGRIAAVGPASELGRGTRHPDSVILPGLVDAHAHLEYAAYAGFGDGLPFVPWIGLHIERKRRLELADMEAIARLGAHECLRSGITTVGDLSFSGAAAVACAEAGLRAVVYLEVFGEGPEALGRFHELRERVAGSLSARVRLGVSPHAPTTCSLSLYEACAGLGLPVATHLAESAAERDWVERGAGEWAALGDVLAAPWGRRAIPALAEAGLLGPGVVAAHCVHVDPDEVALLAEHGAAVAHCPRSNALLGCGVAPLADLLAAGVRVCVATDSPASAPSFDLFEELRAAVLAARGRERRPDALLAARALELVTIEAARALGLGDEVGSLTPGKRADLAILSFSGSSFVPWEDPATAVVLGGAPERVAATVVDGEPRYENGERRCPELIAAARRARSRMLR